MQESEKREFDAPPPGAFQERPDRENGAHTANGGRALPPAPLTGAALPMLPTGSDAAAVEPRPPASDVRIEDPGEDPIEPIRPGALAYVSVVMIPAVWMLSLALASRLPAASSVGGPVAKVLLTLVGFAITFGSATWRLLTEVVGGSAGRPRRRRLRGLDIVRLDFLTELRPAATNLIVSALAAGGLTALARSVGAGAGTPVSLGINGAAILVFGALAGSTAAFASFSFLIPYLAWRLQRRQDAFADPDQRPVWAAAALYYAARDLDDPWGKTGPARRERVRRRLELVADLAEKGVRRPEQREDRARVAAAIHALLHAIADTGDRPREIVRPALDEAAWHIESGAWLEALPILEAAADAATRAAGRTRQPPPAPPPSARSTVAIASVTAAVGAVCGALLVWRLAGPAEAAAGAGAATSKEGGEALWSVLKWLGSLLSVLLVGATVYALQTFAATMKPNHPRWAATIENAAAKLQGAKGAADEDSAKPGSKLDQ